MSEEKVVWEKGDTKVVENGDGTYSLYFRKMLWTRNFGIGDLLKKAEKIHGLDQVRSSCLSYLWF